ncbi:MAG TPA: DUF1343 domain-containing protein [Phnomibacter sp.]|nr:DUF1343 domain-containing protein [Phnomibacter sp.]
MRFMLHKCLALLLASSLITTSCAAQVVNMPSPNIFPAADRMETYLPLLKGKRVAIFANQTSVVGPQKTHLVDTLLKAGVTIAKIFAPEHGFRGTADAGEKVGNQTDPATGLPIISLYGSKRRPSAADMADVDIMLFDLQDVGLRYYTYISALEDYMIACFENSKPLLVLDRPNPNGFYVDGPVLEKPFRSYVGMQPVPIVYGMTIGEYGMMLAGEKWLSPLANQQVARFEKLKPTPDTPFHFLVIKCQGYTHSSYYELPVKPSPNLPNMQSVLLYASTCYFEGTPISLGRGTNKPFQVYGHPAMPAGLPYTFTPQSVEGAKNPPLLGQKCYGVDLSTQPIDITQPQWQRIQLKYLIDAYQAFPGKDSFFLRPSKNNPAPSDYFFNKLAGNATLMRQLMNQVPEEAIRASWQPSIEAFKRIRKKYLLYPDFE